MSGGDADRLFFMAHDLGGAGHWADAIGVQMRRVLEASWDPLRDRTPAAQHRLQYECYFFLAAVRQLLRVCDAYSRVTKDKRLEDARAQFQTAAGDVVKFRDWFEHLDAYFDGVGNMQKSGEVGPGAVLSIRHDDERVVLLFDDRALDLPATWKAAKLLAKVASEVWMEHAILNAPPGFRTMRRP